MTSNITVKAGLIPICKFSESDVRYLMMVSSDPKFGGSRPMVSKGGVDEGEDILQAAIREAEEELGYRKSNAISDYTEIYDKVVTTKAGDTYRLVMYAVFVDDRKAFDKPCYETKFTPWMTLESFKQKGRKDHVEIVEAASKLI